MLAGSLALEVEVVFTTRVGGHLKAKMNPDRRRARQGAALRLCLRLVLHSGVSKRCARNMKEGVCRSEC